MRKTTRKPTIRTSAPRKRRTFGWARFGAVLILLVICVVYIIWTDKLPGKDEAIGIVILCLGVVAIAVPSGVSKFLDSLKGKK